MRWRLRHPIVPGNNLHVATAFPRVTLCCGIPQEILQRLEYERPEPSTTPIGTIEETTFKHHYKKILCQVLSIGNGVALAADEGENRSPINFAKRGQRGARLFLVVARIGTGKYHAPARRQEAVGPLGPAWGADWFQGRRLLHGRIYETSRKTSYLLRPVARALKGARTKIFAIFLQGLEGEVNARLRRRT